MIRRSIWIATGVAIALGAHARAQAPEPSSVPPPAVLTVEQAVREALDHNLNLVSERFNVAVADTAIRTASLRPNPVLTFNVARPDRGLVDAGLSPNEQVVRTDYLFERGDKRERRIGQAELAKSVTELQLLNTARTVTLDVQTAFTDVQSAKLNLALAEENLRAFNDVVRVNVQRVRTGDLSAVELSRSRLAALQFQNDLRQQEGRLRAARNRLSALLGRGSNGDALDVTGSLRSDPDFLDYDTLRRRALEARPDLRAAQAEQARSLADIRLQLANGIVDYTVSGEYHRQESAAVRGNSFAVFFSVPLPLFNRNQGEIGRAQVQQDQLRARVTALEREVTKELDAAFAEYSTARDILETIEQQMLGQARHVRTTTEYSYRRGEATFVEFLDAVRAFNDTAQSYNDARAAYARSLYALDSIAGKVNP